MLLATIIVSTEAEEERKVIYAAIVIGAVAAGIVQSVTGFGAAIFLMLILPHFFDMVTAGALASSISMTLALMLAWKFRKQVNWKMCVIPTMIYLMCSVTVINFVKGMDLELLSLAFGVFLILVALYSLFVSRRITASGSRTVAVVCAVISGVTSGLFGIGGPLMALYFAGISESKESYIGNIQFLFAVTNIANLATRVSKGIYTVDLIPLTLIGFVFISVGKRIGLKILEKLNVETMKKIVYVYAGISGVVTVLENVL